jgi:heme/copper-type cytochrome/quinol oxidase subunit 2
MKRNTTLILLTLAVAVLVIAPQAFGCPVCYGESDDQIVQGAQMSVLFMAALTYLLLVGGAVLTFVLYRRRLRLRSPETGGPVSVEGA